MIAGQGIEEVVNQILIERDCKKDYVADKFAMQDAEAAAVLNHFIKGGRSTQYGLLNAVTRTAEDLKDYDRAIEFERIGGDIMLMKPTEFSLN